jgi:hypothetical protein
VLQHIDSILRHKTCQILRCMNVLNKSPMTCGLCSMDRPVVVYKKGKHCMELVAFILTEIAFNLQEAGHPHCLRCLASLELSVSCFLKSFPECLHIKVTDHSWATLSLCFARDGLERRHHHLQPDFTVASTNSSRSSNSYNGTGVTAFGVTVKTCFREASVGKLSRKMSFECGNSSSLMVCSQ